MSYNKRELQKSLYEITQKNSNMFNHVFDEMKKMKAEIKLLKSKVAFQDSVLYSVLRPSVSGIYDAPSQSVTSHETELDEDIYDVPQRRNLTVDDLICDVPAESSEPVPSLTMDDFFRKSQIKGIRPVPLIRQTNRTETATEKETTPSNTFVMDMNMEENTVAEDTLEWSPLVRQSCYVPKFPTGVSNGVPPLGLPPLVSRDFLPPPFPAFVSTEPKSEYISPFNYTSYQSGLNYV